MTARPLARSLAPLPDESLPGFLLRLATRLGRSPSRLATLCGLTERSGRIPIGLLEELPGTTARAFAQAAGLSTAEAHELTLQRFTTAYPPLRAVHGVPQRTTVMLQAQWALDVSTRYCPPCLHGDASSIQRAFGGAFKLQWHLPVTFACPIHHRLLEAACPACRRPLNTATLDRLNLVGSPRASHLHALQCRNEVAPAGAGRPGSRHCGAWIDGRDVAGQSSETLVSRADLDRLLDVQRIIDHHLHHVPDTAAKYESSPPSYFTDLIMAAHVIRLSWPLGAHLLPSAPLQTLLDAHAAPLTALVRRQTTGGHQPRRTGARAAPTDTAQCAALLLAADTLIGESDPNLLREQAQPLMRAAYSSAPMYSGQISRSLDISPRLARALAIRSYGSHGHRSLRATGRKRGYSAQEVPAYLPRAWFDAYFDGFLDRIPQAHRPRARAVRRAASLRLAELACGAPWTECAEILGLPPGIAAKLLTILGARLDATRMWPDFELRVDRIADHLDTTDDRVNYANRRRRLATWHMPGPDWWALSDGIPRLTRLHQQGDPAIGTVLVWSEATRGEPVHSPLMRELRRRGGDCATLSLEAKHLQAEHLRGARLHLRQRLDTYACLLAAASDRGKVLQVSTDVVLASVETGTAPVPSAAR
ncbi:TniQ family protein [Kitasatospora purpeofusca]|uniref:TniQ family protein n=1 Tax=Kitasatospora purpeofusca TaxID=67352 RepID=UPI0004C16E2F|nr:TniQ family protein [Kitasatospora purpeofusca]